jgi:flagellar protein FliS
MKLPNAALAYRESALLGASPVGMIVLLYDRLAQDIHNAAAALHTNDVEARAEHVNHALLVLQQLQGTLDFAQGGEAARQLDAFYSLVRAKLLEAQIRQSRDLLREQAQAVVQVRESWATIDAIRLDEPSEAGAATETPAQLPTHEAQTPASTL